MNILVSGSSGFIGSNLVNKLNKIFINATIIKLDHNYKRLTLNNLEYDFYFHLAGGQGNTFEDTWNKNVNTLISILHKIDFKVKKVILASSLAVYGNITGEVFEDMTCKPASYYGFAKMHAEKCLEFLAMQYGFTFYIARLSSVYGIDQRKQVIYDLIKRFLESNYHVKGHLDTARDFIHVDDVCNALLLLSTLGNNKIYNVGSGEPITLNVLLNIIVKHLKKDNVKITFLDQTCSKIWANIDKIKKEGFFCTKIFDKEILNIVNWCVNEK